MTDRGEPDSWERVTTLFAEARDMEESERDSFLTRMTGGDLDLRETVEDLIAVSGSAARFFDELQQDAIPRAVAAFDGEAAPADRTGRTYGPYQVHEMIGRGGMGIVYRATDTRLSRSVALKFLPGTAFADPAAHSRLVDEARAASRLDDPNICTIFAVDETPDGETFIAMALYEGETLAERIAREPVPLGDALSIAVGIARGLAVAHSRGIIHRDLTPRNVMLTARDRVKILDFGLAHAAGLGTGVAAAGTPAYMSPEQFRGAEPGPTADIWSFGVTFYELFTGRKPFQGDDVGPTVDSVLASAPRPPRQLNPRIPEPLERLILRMLEKDPAARPVDGGDVVALLEPMLQRHRSRRIRLVMTAVVAALTLLVVGLFLTRGPPRAPSEVPAIRLVLLPIERDPADPSAVYLAGSLRELFTDHLSRITGLALISWTGAGQAENTSSNRKRVGRALGAAAVLEGRVVAPFTVQLALHDVGNDRVIWSTRHDFTIGSVNAAGRTLSLDIGSALGIARASSRPEVQQPGTFAIDPRTGHVYEGVPVPLNWFDARDAAAARTYQGMTGHLATIGSREENEFVRINLPQAFEGSHWLGGFQDIQAQGASREGWAWVTGEPFAFTNWAPGEPNDYFGEDGINTDTDAQWNDGDRTTGFELFIKGFLVEYEPVSQKSQRPRGAK